MAVGQDAPRLGHLAAHVWVARLRGPQMQLWTPAPEPSLSEWSKPSGRNIDYSNNFGKLNICSRRRVKPGWAVLGATTVARRVLF